MPAEALRPATDDWDAHWDDYAVAAERNPAQRYRRRMVLFLVGRRGEPTHLLDIGSGQGDFLRAASRAWPAARLLGLEVSARGNAIAQAKVPRARLLEADLGHDHEPAAGYRHWATHAVCTEVLEHVDDAVCFLGNARKYLAPGARLVVTVPGGPMSAFDQYIGHRRHYTPQSLAEAFRAAGLRPAFVGGAGFPFFNLYRRLVIARGDAIATEVRGRPNLLAEAVMMAFRPLLRVSLPRSPWGLQIVGVAHEPGQHVAEELTPRSAANVMAGRDRA